MRPKPLTPKAVRFVSIGWVAFGTSAFWFPACPGCELLFHSICLSFEVLPRHNHVKTVRDFRCK